MTQTKFKNILSTDTQQIVASHLQTALAQLLDLTLQLKQVHWNVQGPRFQSLHNQLDDIVLTCRNRSDEVAERIATLNIPARGGVQCLDCESALKPCPDGFLEVTVATELVVEQLFKVVSFLRNSIHVLGEHDPVSQDLMIGVASELEKHLWMVQSQLDVQGRRIVEHLELDEAVH